MPNDRPRLLREDEWQSSVLREAAEKMNFILLVTSAYRPPEFLSFLDALSLALGKAREFLEARAALRRACGPDV
jgi:hypothetical protein